jgi:hypothetical protein
MILAEVAFWHFPAHPPTERLGPRVLGLGCAIPDPLGDRAVERWKTDSRSDGYPAGNNHRSSLSCKYLFERR